MISFSNHESILTETTSELRKTSDKNVVRKYTQYTHRIIEFGAVRHIFEGAFRNDLTNLNRHVGGDCFFASMRRVRGKIGCWETDAAV